MVSIVVRLDLDIDGKTLGEVEAELMGQLRAAIGPALQAELAVVVRPVPVGQCGACGQLWRGRGWEPRQVVGLFGAAQLTRQRVQCSRCGTSAYPADHALGLEAQDRYSLGVAEAALWFAADIHPSYWQARRSRTSLALAV